ncbi:MAG: DUF4422 domain-containing protein [Eubacterium sp.]|nr:DUF4422 domain-containing protein [Eubacterium sp.]
MNTKIFVMTHTKFNCPNADFLIPLHVGREGKDDLGYLADNTGDNISAKNYLYGELSGYYWLWKNVSDIDIIGICHYRRFFLSGGNTLLTPDEIEKILSASDLITSNAIVSEKSVREGFAEVHGDIIMQQTGDVIKKLCPDYTEAFEWVLSQNKSYYSNLCIMKKELFDRYCKWLFDICFSLEDVLDLSHLDDYHKRIYGFISEVLLFVFAKANNLKISEGNIGISQEKAETAEFKLALTQLVRLGQFSEARTIFYEYQKMRPDIRLPLSDIKNEIPDIELILYILEQESLVNVQGFYSVSHELSELITHLRKTREILKSSSPLSKEDETYLSNTNVSEIAKQIILIN